MTINITILQPQFPIINHYLFAYDHFITIMYSMKKLEKSVTTRYPIELYAELKQRAEKNGRSFNAEVVYELQQYRQPGQSALGTIPASAISIEDLGQPGLSIEESWKNYAL